VLTHAVPPQSRTRGHAWRVLAVAACLVLIGRATASAGSTVVVFTVDVESKDALPLPRQVDAVCSGGSPCGLMEIARLLHERGWSGTFFLNVYERAEWGDAAMESIAQRLRSTGQDVALHTHPQWSYDPQRPGMNEYSLEEQTAIVRDGVRLLQAWTGQQVVAHRAGGYAADQRTLIALERNGVLLDSSMFWTHENNRLDGLGLPANVPGRYGRVTEIPVTVYEREDRPALLGAFVAPFRVLRKIDPNWLASADEARASIEAAVADDVPVLVVFLHSFSFMVDRPGPASIADRHAMDMFRAIVDEVTKENLGVVSMRDLAAPARAVALSQGDSLPRVTVAVGLPRYVWRRARTADRVLLSTAAGAPLLSVAALVALAWRRKAIRDRRGHAFANGPKGVPSP